MFPMIADVLITLFFKHADMLLNKLRNSPFATINSPGKQVYIRALMTNKKLSWTCADRRMPTAHVQLRFQSFLLSQKLARIPDTLIAGIQFLIGYENR